MSAHLAGRHTMSSWPIAALLLGSVPALGCGAGGTADAVRAEAPTASEALDEKGPACTGVPDVAQPLVVDLNAAQRTDLELAMKSGRAVVGYGCEGLKVLTACTLKGDYKFAGVSLKEEVIQLKSADEVRASLPISGATLSGEVTRGTSLDLAIAMVGRGTALASDAAKGELSGQCDGATHFVRAVYVGAFAMKRGSGAEVSTAATIFGAGGDAKSQSSKQTDMRDGSLDDCKKASPDADAPPAQCASSIRVQLFPLGEKGDSGDTGLAALTNPCPEGYQLTGGKCAPAAKAEAFLCAPGDEASCRAQCDAGNLGSCFNLAHVLSKHDALCKDKGASCIAVPNAAEGQPEFKALSEAAKLYERTCDGGIAQACYYVGSYQAMGALGIAKSDDKADATFGRGCAEGHAWSCVALADRVEKKDKASPRALELHERACDLGFKPGCFKAIAKYMKGEGTAKNPVAARAILERTCDAGEGKRCAELGLYTLEGMFGPDAGKDKAKAVGFIARGCDLKDDGACRMVSLAYTGQWGVTKDAAKAKEYFDRACSGAAASTSECTGLAKKLGTK